MATSLDNLVNSTTIAVGGSTISLAGIDEKLRGVLLVALIALARTYEHGALSGGKVYGSDACSTGARVRVEIAPSAS